MVQPQEEPLRRAARNRLTNRGKSRKRGTSGIPLESLKKEQEDNSPPHPPKRIEQPPSNQHRAAAFLTVAKASFCSRSWINPYWDNTTNRAIRCVKLRQGRLPTRIRKPAPEKVLENLVQNKQANERPDRPQQPPEKETFTRHCQLSFTEKLGRGRPPACYRKPAP